MIRTPVMAFWALVLVNLIWGIGFVVVDDAIEIMPVNTFNTFRFGVATLALLPLLFFMKKPDKSEFKYTNRQLFKAGFGLGLLLFLGFSLQTQGLLYTSVSNTGFITGMCVPLVPIIGFLLFKIKVGKEVWLSVLTASIGLYFLTMGDKLEFNKGDVLVALSAVCYASHISLMARYGGRFAIIPLSILQLGAVTCYSAVAALFEMNMEATDAYMSLMDQLNNKNVIGAILYSALLASAFAYWAQTSSQRLIEPHKVALIFALEPIFAHIAAYFILDEQLGIKGWIGASLIIAGMLYSELGGRRKVKIQALDQMAAPIDK
ncbi:DMT family transporter [Pseudoalteromonas sp. C2R02]|uniref:DMT family transporter n=1 Tax=Pseudoalteromonas sp. C2R02 TaxID=2841565 RepID=UPI001C08AEAC|nr:DMT family transporter [Pseudoalteromonas sp. C2R02]MBU2968694.1 DMT family transporter [Pseudoalteromonas sp. C2R02]